MVSIDGLHALLCSIVGGIKGGLAQLFLQLFFTGHNCKAVPSRSVSLGTMQFAFSGMASPNL